MKKILLSYLVCFCCAAGISQTAPAITALGATTICSGQSATLMSDKPYGNQWYKNGIAISSATGQNYNATSTGNYTVKSGGLTSNAISVSVLASPAANISPSGTVAICSGSSRTLTASSAGVNGTYLWSTGETTQSIAVSSAGSYNVTLTYANGCSKTSANVTTYVQPLPAPPAITAGGATQFCPGGSVTLTSTAEFNNQWFKNGVAISGATGKFYTATSSGTYTAKMKSGTCYSPASNSIAVTVFSAPKPTISPSGTVVVCIGSTKTLTSSYAGAGGTYLWSNGATTRSIVVSTADTFQVTVTYANGCSSTSNKVITVLQAPPAALTISAAGPTTFCAGGNVQLQASPSPGYRWFRNGMVIAGATSQNFTATQSGNYTVKAISGGCLSPASNTITVSVLPAPAAVISPSGNVTICNGSSQVLTSGAASSYLWSTGETSQSISVSSSGSYYVTVTGANGCSKKSNTVTLNVATPHTTISANGPLTFCSGGSVVLSSDSASAYLWSTGETTRSITATQSGQYFVTITDQTGCLGNSDTVTVTVNNPPVVNAGPDQLIYIGYGQQNANLHANANGNNPFKFLWNTGDTISQITVSPATTTSYTIHVTDSNSCAGTDDVTVNVVDILCDENEEKVYICHLPGSENENTLCVSPSAVAAHLSHGDYLGSCSSNSRISKSPQKETEIMLYPNPTDGTDLTLIVKNCDERQLTITIYDANMRECYRKSVLVSESGNANVKLEAAAYLPTGLYFISASGKQLKYNTKLAIKN